MDPCSEWAWDLVHYSGALLRCTTPAHYAGERCTQSRIEHGRPAAHDCPVALPSDVVGRGQPLDNPTCHLASTGFVEVAVIVEEFQLAVHGRQVDAQTVGIGTDGLQSIVKLLHAIGQPGSGQITTIFQPA